MQAHRAHEKQEGGLMRSMLFVPGDRPERFAKAVASGAGALSLDGRMLDKPHMRQAERILAAAAARR
jgi:citrate lyase subunit beta/citryl-CoA lyase